MVDRFTKCVLTVIALMLVVIVFQSTSKKAGAHDLMSCNLDDTSVVVFRLKSGRLSAIVRDGSVTCL